MKAWSDSSVHRITSLLSSAISKGGHHTIRHDEFAVVAREVEEAQNAWQRSWSWLSMDCGDFAWIHGNSFCSDDMPQVGHERLDLDHFGKHLVGLHVLNDSFDMLKLLILGL